MPGVLELLPREQIAFDRMISIIRREFERFGFVPLSTPAIELTETLLTKSGGDTERQVYFVQSTGALDQPREGPPELALRFDLTVPLARYVAEHEHALTFPFRRYQIQRVYRGERAQRGRFREFHQCDIDVIGRGSLPVLVDAEMPAVIHSVFRKLELGPFVISLNHRRLMRGFLAGFGLTDPARQADVLREIDKLDKRGPAAVTTTLADDYGLGASAAEILSFIGKTSVDHADALRLLAEIPGDDPELIRGREELITVLEGLRAFGLPEGDYRLDFSIARGLDYYTGSVFETRLVDHPEIGSVCSGGRYDNLAGQYTKSHLPGVGISIGATRLFWQLREAGLIDLAGSTVQALVALLEPDDLERNLALAAELRAGGINTEVQLEPRKLAKQFQYADRAGIRFVVMAGADEWSRSAVAVKDLDRGAQFEMPRDELVQNLAVEIEQARAMPPTAIRASDRSQSE